MYGIENPRISVVNPKIVDESKRFIVIVGCAGLSAKAIREIVCEEVADGILDKKSESNIDFESFDECHPADQIKYVEILLKDPNEYTSHTIIHTNSPFVLQSFFHFSGRGDTPVGYYECSLNEETCEVTLTDVSHDTRETFARMADCMNSIMSWTEYHKPAAAAEDTLESRKEPRYVRFSKELDYWFGECFFDDKNYDQLDNENAWDNFIADFPSLISDGDVFQLIIDIRDGKVINWPEGHTGEFYTVKIVDTGDYELIDGNKHVLKHLHGYVPEFLSIAQKGWGDYLEFEVQKDGYIKDWKFGDAELKEINETWE